MAIVMTIIIIIIVVVSAAVVGFVTCPLASSAFFLFPLLLSLLATEVIMVMVT